MPFQKVTRASTAASLCLFLLGSGSMGPGTKVTKVVAASLRCQERDRVEEIRWMIPGYSGALYRFISRHGSRHLAMP